MIGVYDALLVLLVMLRAVHAALRGGRRGALASTSAHWQRQQQWWVPEGAANLRLTKMSSAAW